MASAILHIMINNQIIKAFKRVNLTLKMMNFTKMTLYMKIKISGKVCLMDQGQKVLKL